MVEHVRIRRFIARGLVVGMLVGVPSLVNAGDGPLFTPVGAFTDGRAAKHVWTVIGAAKKNGIVTSISCTSLDLPGSSTDIGVEFFDDAGTELNNVSTPAGPGACNGSMLGLAAGSSVTIANGGTAQFHEDCVVGMGTFAGSARIVSTSTKIACIALLEDSKSVIEDAAGNPTGRTPAVTRLTLVKRNKQAGD